MKRKIAAIMAADVAGYSRLVSEDEEETLRRLAAYREVFDDFVVKASGRIFNTAGDAVLAEFSSAVEAVRCAIDVQESLRTRNMAYPPSRQMSFRIGITIGDVVEREGDLLGDGVNNRRAADQEHSQSGACLHRRNGRRRRRPETRAAKDTGPEGGDAFDHGARRHGRGGRRGGRLFLRGPCGEASCCRCAGTIRAAGRGACNGRAAADETCR
jgi:hypothetical protein